ncbi:MAG: hypothetical protein WBV85_08550 [Solirubrobacteraceae bacterium]
MTIDSATATHAGKAPDKKREAVVKMNFFNLPTVIVAVILYHYVQQSVLTAGPGDATLDDEMGGRVALILTSKENRMKAQLAVLIGLFLCAGTVGCGGAHKDTDSTSSSVAPAETATTISPSAPPNSYLKNDGDKDSDDEGHRPKVENDDRVFFAMYGRRADPADKRAVTILIKHYYTAAAAEDSKTTCSLLASNLLPGFTDGKDASGQNALSACAASISSLLRQQHRQLLADNVPTMVVTSVHVKGDLGVAALGFRATPEGEIVVEREGHVWKMGALLDTDLT